MLINQTLDKLDALGLFGMGLGLREQLESNQYLNLSFDERLGLLVDRETEARDSRRLALRLKAAKLRQEASVEDIDFRTPRGLDRSVIMSLAQAGWVTAHHNLLVTGPTGAGKSFIGCALAHAAIRRGHTALYLRTPRLLADLALSRGDGRYVRRLAHLAKIGVLVLDDFLLTPPSIIEAKDLLEVIDDRSQVRSTLVISQLPVEAWHPALTAGDPTLADAILDRLVHALREQGDLSQALGVADRMVLRRWSGGVLREAAAGPRAGGRRTRAKLLLLSEGARAADPHLWRVAHAHRRHLQPEDPERRAAKAGMPGIPVVRRRKRRCAQSRSRRLDGGARARAADGLPSCKACVGSTEHAKEAEVPALPAPERESDKVSQGVNG